MSIEVEYRAENLVSIRTTSGRILIKYMEMHHSGLQIHRGVKERSAEGLQAQGGDMSAPFACPCQLNSSSGANEMRRE